MIPLAGANQRGEESFQQNRGSHAIHLEWSLISQTGLPELQQGNPPLHVVVAVRIHGDRD